MDNSGVGTGPGVSGHLSSLGTDTNKVLGPIRHPRPLTAAELHLELEKEQEGIVSLQSRYLDAVV